jgi:flagellar M-ring protein FliF
LRNGQTLAKTQVNGIVHLVSSSVEGLQVKDVTVVDGHGRLLSSSAGSDDAAGLTGSQLEYQRTVEKDIETRIQTMLERIVGVNKAVVRVSSILDFRKIETTEERYDPNSQVVRSEQRGQEKANGVNGVSGGVPGVQSNVPDGTAQEPAQTSSSNNQTKNETVNYEISRTVSRVVESSGSIKQLSVAVLVDGIYEMAAPSEAGKAGSDTAKKYIARPEEDMKRIEEIVKKAMGYSAERQDQVQVTNVQFDIATEEPPAQGIEAAAEPANSFTPYIRYGVGGGLFLLILFMVVRPLMAMLGTAGSSTGSSADGTPPLPASVSQIEASLTGGKPRSQIVDMARGNPDTTALVVKQWLKTS